MKKIFILLAAVLALSLGLMMATPVAADPGTTYYVSTTGSDETGTGTWWNPWRTIQHAVDQVSSGDTITVAPGEYAGAVVNKQVVITGNPGEAPLITSGVPYKVGSGLTTAFRLDAGADGAEINDFTISCNQSAGFYFAVFSKAIDDVIIDNLQINDTVQGITNWGGSGWTITNNMITDTVAAGGGGIGILVGALPPSYRTCSDNLIQYNTIDASATAEDYSCPGIVVCLDTRYGAYEQLDFSEDVSGNQILDNTVIGNGGENSAGVEIGVIGLEGDPDKIAATTGIVDNNAILSNTIEAVDLGLYVYVASNLTAADNDITGSSYGLYASDGIEDATIEDNTFTSNTIQVEDTSGGLDLDLILDSNTFDRAVVVRGSGIKIPTIFSSIQDAVDAADPGDTVEVRAGIYDEQVLINKDLTLQGIGDPVIKAPVSPSAFTFPESGASWEPVVFAFGGTSAGGSISGNDTITVDVSCLIVDGDDRVPTDRSAGILLRNAGGTISDNTVQKMYIDSKQTFGIMVYGDSSVAIVGNDVSGYARGGIGANGDSVTSSPTYPTPHAVIEGNTVTGPGVEVPVTWAPNGIQIGWGATGEITGNNVTANGWPGTEWSGSGIIVAGADGVEVDGNDVHDNETGIAVCGWMWNPAGVTADSTWIHHNTVDGNTYGISIQDKSYDTTIEYNAVMNSGYDGIDICNFYGYAPTGTLIRYNTITANNAEDDATSGGMWIDDGVDGNEITVNFNEIAGNNQFGILNTGTTSNVDATANWWGDASGPYHATTNPPGTGDVVSDSVDYSPWWGANYIGLGHPWNWYTNDSVQEAVDAASAGDTVNVMAGTYDEQVTVDKSLVLIGAGRDETFLKAAGSPIITVSADDVIIQNLEITDDPYLVEGIRVVSGASTGLMVAHVDFTELGAGTGANAYGIYIANSFANLSVTDCDFVPVEHTTYYRTIGIFAPNHLQLSDFEVSDSTFQKIWTGIYLRSAVNGLDVIGSRFGQVQSSDFAACVSGIYIGDGDDYDFDIENVVISDNTFTEYGRGVYVWNYANDGSVTNFEIYGNNFTNSVWSSAIRFIGGLGDNEGVSLDGISVHDNAFAQNSTVGAHVALIDFRTYCELADCDIAVADNEIALTEGPYTDPWSGIAFLAYEGPFTNTLVDGNVLDGGNCGGGGTPPSTGVLLKHESSTYWPSGILQIDITHNEITGFGHGIGIYDNVGAEYGGLPTGCDVDINYNEIHGNALYGVINGNSEHVDATYNWWGNVSGPYHATLNPDGEGDAVSDNVLFVPWFGDKEMTMLEPHSTYKFVYDVPDLFVACQETVVPVTFQTDELGYAGYDDVRFKFYATGPGNVIFKATDPEEVEHTFVNSGYWGPASGFPLSADYSATTDWTLNFTEPGEYTITFALIEAPEGEVIAGIEGSEVVTVRAEDIQDYYRHLHEPYDEITTDDLLAAIDDWLADVIPPGFEEPISTLQLLELVDEWLASGP